MEDNLLLVLLVFHVANCGSYQCLLKYPQQLLCKVNSLTTIAFSKAKLLVHKSEKELVSFTQLHRYIGQNDGVLRAYKYFTDSPVLLGLVYSALAATGSSLHGIYLTIDLQ